jgi:TM2 domain-containing membrane protein YozV
MAFCASCGFDKGAARFCANCGAVDPSNSQQNGSPFAQPMATVPLPPPPRDGGNKLAAGLCGILVGALGIHKFVLGYRTEGLVMLLVSVLTCGIGAIPMGVIGLVEGIIYLTKTDEDFHRIYVVGRKGWF